jgi:hypothetical protein
MQKVMSVLLLVAASLAPLSAHHSFAMFDTAKPVTIEGVVTAFEWTNPHAYIELDVPDGKGGHRHWSIELGSTSILMRAGWKFNTLKKGDKVSALISPLRTGEPGSLLNRLTLADGRVLLNGPGGAAATPAAPATQP